MSLTIPPIGFHCLRDYEKQGAAAWRGIYLDKTIPRLPSSPAQVIGTAVHALALEGREALDKGFTVMPGGEWESDDRRVAQEAATGTPMHVLAEPINRRTKDGKAAWAAAELAAAGKLIILASELERIQPLTAAYAAAAGRTVLSATDMDMVIRMGTAVRECPEAMALIQGGAVEVDLDGEEIVETTTGPVTVPVRGRLDIAGPGWVADLKTTEDMTPAVFDRSIVNYDYHRQLAYYNMLRLLSGDMEPMRPDGRAFIIGVEKPPTPFHPVRVEVLAIPDSLLEIGDRNNRTALANLAGAFINDSWSPAVRGVRVLRAPAWVS